MKSSIQFQKDRELVIKFAANAPWAIALLPERYADDADVIRAASEAVGAALTALAETNDVA